MQPWIEQGLACHPEAALPPSPALGRGTTSALSWGPASLPWALAKPTRRILSSSASDKTPFCLMFLRPSASPSCGPTPNDFSEISRVKSELPSVKPSE